MSTMLAFFKVKKTPKENGFYPATKRLCDDEGKPLQWEIKPLTTKEDEEIRAACTREIPIIGRPSLYRQKIDTNAYISKLLVASVVYPDLHDAELQDSYGVKKPEDLLKEIIDDPGEYGELLNYVQELSGFNVSLKEKIDDAKN